MWPFDIVKKKRKLVAKHKKRKIIILCSSIGTIVVGGGTIVGVVLALPKQQPEPKPSPPPSVRNLTINVDDNQKNIGQSTVITTAIQGTFEAHNFNVADLSLVSDSIDFFKDLNFDSSTKEFSVKLNPSDTDGTYDLRLWDTSNNVYSNIITITIRPENYLIYDSGGTDIIYTIDVSGNFLTARTDGENFEFTDLQGSIHNLSKIAIKEFYLEDLLQITVAPNGYLTNMCCGFSNLTKVDIRIPNTIVTVNNYFCSNMFSGCSSLAALPSSFNLPQSISGAVGTYFCSKMFNGCTLLSTLPVNFNLPQSISGAVGDFFCLQMFYGCLVISALPSDLNLPIGITSVGTSFCGSMFQYCFLLSSLPVNFNLPQNISGFCETFCSGMFNNCSGLNNDLFATPINIPVGISWTTYCCYDMFGGSCPVEPSSPSTPGQSIFVKRS